MTAEQRADEHYIQWRLDRERLGLLKPLPGCIDCGASLGSKLENFGEFTYGLKGDSIDCTGTRCKACKTQPV